MILFGWIGVAILVMSYLLLLFANIKWFYLIDGIASLILTFHAIAINDIPFILVNGFITIVLLYKYMGELKNESR